MKNRKGKSKKGATRKRPFKKSIPQYIAGQPIKIQKRKGRFVYDVVLPNGQKDTQKISDIIDKQNFHKINRGELPDNFVKITFVARLRKKRASISYIYDIDELEQLSGGVQDMWQTIINKTVTRKTKSLKRINALKHYVNRIIVDFDSAT